MLPGVGEKTAERMAFFSLEMTKEQLGCRLLSSRARVSGDQMRRAKLNDAEWVRLLQAMQTIMKSPIYVDETPAISITKLSAKARRLKTESNIGMLIIDYLQLMTGTGNTNSREQEISEISRSLKSLSKELGVPIIALSQLNRGVEARPNKRPMLQDLRESGAIEQDADVITFIYRDDYYNADLIHYYYFHFKKIEFFISNKTIQYISHGYFYPNNRFIYYYITCQLMKFNNTNAITCLFCDRNDYNNYINVKYLTQKIILE